MKASSSFPLSDARLPDIYTGIALGRWLVVGIFELAVGIEALGCGAVVLVGHVLVGD